MQWAIGVDIPLPAGFAEAGPLDDAGMLDTSWPERFGLMKVKGLNL